jgi:outer membrane protein OmpA-like peptidoglycan-associated protein
MRPLVPYQRRLWASAAFGVCGLCLSLRASAAPSTIPLCPGLTIVTAITQTEGDYESIKTIEKTDDDGIRLKYSNERPVQDRPDGPSKIRRMSVARVVRNADLDGAHLYLQQYQNNAPVTVPGTTAIGVSSAVLSALKTRGEAELGVFDLPPSPLSADPDNHPSIFDYRLVTTIRRAEETPVMLALTVNGEKAELPAIHATGEFGGEKAEFYFLDDESNPLTLRFRLGIGSKRSAEQPTATDRDTLQVVKIAYECNASAAREGRLERALSKVGRRVDVYDIYFSFNSDKIRPESEPTLRELGDLLERHGDWKLTIDGHTDGIGGDEKNLDLSKRRSAAVKVALIERFKIDEGRLITSGYGKTRPKDTNDTPEGRARNRRVELVRRE